MDAFLPGMCVIAVLYLYQQMLTLGGDQVGKLHVLIMDEVDGMSGNEDKGGVQV